MSPLPDDERAKLEARLVQLFCKAEAGAFGWKIDTIKFKSGALTADDAKELGGILRNKLPDWNDYYDSRSSYPDGSVEICLSSGGATKLRSLLESYGKEKIAHAIIDPKSLVGSSYYEGDIPGISKEDGGASVNLDGTVLGQVLSQKYDPTLPLSSGRVLAQLHKSTGVQWQVIILETDHGDLPCYRTCNIQASPQAAKQEIEAALGTTILQFNDGYVTIPQRTVIPDNFGSLIESEFTAFSNRNVPPPEKYKAR